MQKKAQTKAVQPKAAERGGALRKEAPAPEQEKQSIPGVVDFGKLTILPKLAVSPAGDPLEREADRIAERVVRAPATQAQGPLTALEHPRLQAKSATGNAVAVTPQVHARIDALRGGGQPLSPQVRSYFEPRLGADFSQVRVHRDRRADEAAQLVRARAFATGNDVVFRSGQYNPDTLAGRKLLAHELVHVVQQGGVGNGNIQRSGEPDTTEQEQHLESEAISDDQKGVDVQGLILYEKKESNKVGPNNTGYKFYAKDGRALSYSDVSRFIFQKQKEGDLDFIKDFPFVEESTNTPAVFTIENSTTKYKDFKFSYRKEEKQGEKDDYIGRIVSIKASISAPNGIRLHETPTPEDKVYQSKAGIAEKIYSKGQKVEIIAKANEKNSGWILIKTEDGNKGWIESYYIEENKHEALAPYIKKYFKVEVPGQGLEDVIEQEYYNDYNIEIGNDFYDIAKAIAILNADNPGIYFTDDDDPHAFIKDLVDSSRSDVRKNYQSIRIKLGAVIKLPTVAYIDILRKSGAIGTRSDAANMAIEFGRGSIGLLDGLATGFINQAVETVTDAWDMIKGIFTGELWEQFKELYNFFKDLTWQKAKDLFNAFASDFERKWNQKNVYEKWKFRGEIIGRILFEIVLAIFTAGAGLLKNITKIKAVQKFLAHTQKLASKLKKIVHKPIKGAKPDTDAIKKIFDPSTATNKQKGNFGEIISKDNLINNPALKKKGYNLKRIGNEAPSGLDDKLKKGIDGIYENSTPPPKFVIDEAKFGSSKLGKTKDGPQMSDDWVRARLESQLGPDKADEIMRAMDEKSVEKVLSRIDENGNVTIQRLDENGKAIGNWP